MAKEKEIDRLAKEADEALALGMSYGKYKAMQQAQPIKPKEPPLLHDGIQVFGRHPEREMVCVVCGKKYISRCQRRMYCSELCKERAYIEKKRAQREPERNQGGEKNA